MKAPEKIFLEWYRIGDKKYRDWCITPQTNNEPVEYTRTDAFIEKACEWLKENCKGYILVDIDNKYVGIDGLFLEHFRKYMKK